jgi:hypothetical protein
MHISATLSEAPVAKGHLAPACRETFVTRGTCKSLGPLGKLTVLVIVWHLAPLYVGGRTPTEIAGFLAWSRNSP